jgi:hypothetical protein
VSDGSFAHSIKSRIERKDLLTIHVSVVYMARDVMILVKVNPFRGPLEGVGPKKSRDQSLSSL